MNTKQTLDSLWDGFREAINKAYAANKSSVSWEGTACLRDYAENISWNDRLSALLGRESANERQHRSGRPNVPGFSIQSASKLILMSQAAQGASLADMPPATLFLWSRQTAAEAQVIGFLCRDFLPQEWRSGVDALDYSKLMQDIQ